MNELSTLNAIFMFIWTLDQTFLSIHGFRESNSNGKGLPLMTTPNKDKRVPA